MVEMSQPAVLPLTQREDSALSPFKSSGSHCLDGGVRAWGSNLTAALLSCERVNAAGYQKVEVCNV